MQIVDSNTSIEVLDRDRCLRLLRRATVGRVAFVDAGRPVCLPVNFALDDERVVFRSAAGTKLGSAVRRSLVAFEVDDLDEAARSGWSVVVSGRAEEVIAASEIERLEKLPLRPWAPHATDHWVAIQADSITGRAVGWSDD